MKASKYQTTKIWAKTLQKLRLIHAITGESQVSIMDRLMTQELASLGSEIRQVTGQSHEDGTQNQVESNP